MHSLTYLLPLLSALTPTLSLPSRIFARDAPICDQYTPVQSGPYSVQNDAWGRDSGTGSQCSQIDGFDGTSLSWSTTFSWDGGPDSIKSYANAEAAGNTPCKPLNQYNSIPTSWSWSYSTSITGDVAYDAFLGDSSCGGPGDKHTYEIMIWLARLGTLNPIGTRTSTIPIGSHTFDLWKGPNTQTGATVYSFVASAPINEFEGDLMAFFDYLVKNEGVDAGLYLSSVQAGTEVAVGKGRFVTEGLRIGSS